MSPYRPRPAPKPKDPLNPPVVLAKVLQGLVRTFMVLLPLWVVFSLWWTVSHWGGKVTFFVVVCELTVIIATLPILFGIGYFFDQLQLWYKRTIHKPIRKPRDQGEY